MLLGTAVRDDKVAQDFDSESLKAKDSHSQLVKGALALSDSGSKDCVNLPSSTAVSRMMSPACVPSTAHLLERYPELLFLLSYTEVSAVDLSVSIDDEECRGDLDLKEIDILYVYGVGRGAIYSQLKGWLKEKRERRLIF